MTCNEVRENLVAYLHGELEKRMVMEIHQHLSGCEACVQEEIELRHTDRLLDQFRAEALPDDFDEKLHQKLRQLDPARHKEQQAFRRIVYAVAATIIIMIGIQFFGSHLFHSLQPSARLVDFPTSQPIFKAETTSTEPSLKERFIQRYVHGTARELVGNAAIR